MGRARGDPYRRIRSAADPLMKLVAESPSGGWLDLSVRSWLNGRGIQPRPEAPEYAGSGASVLPRVAGGAHVLGGVRLSLRWWAR